MDERRLNMAERELQKYFDFNESDLSANRSGILSNKQRIKLEENAKFTNKIFLIAGISIYIIGIIPTLILLLAHANVEFMIIWSIVWISLCGFVGFKVIRIGKSDKSGLILKKVEGKVNIIKEETYNNTAKQIVDDYELHIGGVSFDIDSDLADIIMQGDIYAIYYIKGEKDIMSAEKIR
jgi:hypothetical protein